MKLLGERIFFLLLNSTAWHWILTLRMPPLFSNRSLCWFHLSKPLLSLLDALECIKRRPDWPKAFYRQNQALMLLKDYKGAGTTLLHALRLDPGNVEIKDGLWKAMESMRISQSSKV